MWSLAEGSCLMTLTGHHDAVTCLNLAFDSRKVISGSLDHNLKFWDLRNGKVSAKPSDSQNCQWNEWLHRDMKFLPKYWKTFHEWVQQTNGIFLKRKFISRSSRVMFYLLYKHQWNTKPFHFNFFWCKRCSVLCSHSNSDLFTCEDNMFLRKSSPGISIVFT